MEGLKRTYTILSILFPLLVIGVPGILLGMVKDPYEWIPMTVSALFAAAPFVATLVFIHRRERVMDDPIKAAGVRFTARFVLAFNLVLWLIPLVEVIVLGPSGFNYGWAILLFAQPFYIYPLVLLLERLGRRLARRRITSG